MHLLRLSCSWQVLLQPSRQELLRRLQARTKVGGHFMPASLLDSQLATLEPHGSNLIALQGKLLLLDLALGY